MIDVTQSMACIHCGACVSDCLSLEVDPLFIGPAALAKAYRFVGDPRDAPDRGAAARPRRGPARHLRLHALLQLRRGLPEGRRADGPDHAPAPPRDARLRASTTPTTAAATRRRSRRSSARRASSTSASCSRTASGRCARRAGSRCCARCRPACAASRAARSRRRRRSSTRSSRASRTCSRIYDHAEQHREELNLYILGEGGDGRARSRR